jgi:hypothetical protein
MGRRKTKYDNRGPLQIMRDQEIVAANARPTVNDHAMRHGDYERHNGRITNRGGTPIARWKTAGLLSDSQQAAIAHCIRLWDLAETTTRVVANLDRTIFGIANDDEKAARVIDARDDLHRIKSGFPLPYWDIYENVCRFDEPAGLAGSRLCSDTSAAAGNARVVVCMVADMIAMRERLTY